jgi:hypothetical protein
VGTFASPNLEIIMGLLPLYIYIYIYIRFWHQFHKSFKKAGTFFPAKYVKTNKNKRWHVSLYFFFVTKLFYKYVFVFYFFNKIHFCFFFYVCILSLNEIQGIICLNL